MQCAVAPAMFLLIGHSHLAANHTCALLSMIPHCRKWPILDGGCEPRRQERAIYGNMISRSRGTCPIVIV